MRYLLLVWLAAGFLRTVELPNGDFSLGMKNWWVGIPKGLNIRSEIIPEGHEGKPALKITMAEPDLKQNAVALDLRKLVFAKGVTYTISFWAKAEPSVVTIRGGVQTTGAGYKALGPIRPIIVEPMWEKHDYTFTAADDGDSCQFTLRDLGVANTTLYFADFQIVEASAEQ